MASRADIKQLLLQVDASVTLAQRNMDQLAAAVQADSDKMSRSLDRVDDATDRLGRGFNAVRNVAATLGVTLGAAGIAQGVRTFLGYADSARMLEAQLRLATSASGNFAQAQEDVRRISTETRSGLEETANLYATFQRNAVELGITQAQAARATETVSKTFQISGASAAEAAGGLRQFLQAIQSGQLRGEEFNSVMENAPRLARLLADSLGVTIGQLRAMAAEGQITGDKLIAALTDRRFTATIDEEFRALPVTFDQAMTQVTNAATITFGAFDQGGEFSSAIASFVLDFTTGADTITDSAEQAGIDIRSAFEGLGDAFLPLWEGAASVFDFIDIRLQGTRDSIGDLLGLYDSIVNIPGQVGNWAHDTDMRLFGWSGGNRTELSDARGRFLRGYDASDRRLQTNAEARRNGLIASGGQSRPGNEFLRYLNAPDEYDMYGRPLRARPRPRSTGGGPSGRRGGGRRARTPTQVDWQGRRESDANIFGANAPSLANDGLAYSLWPEELERSRAALAEIQGELQAIATDMPNLGEMLTTEDQRRLDDFRNTFFDDVSSGLASAIRRGEDLGDVLIDAFARAGEELLASGIFDILSGNGFGGKSGASGFLSFATRALGFGGGRARGGDVMPGKWYLTGEQGPEIIVPKAPGVVIPNGAMMGGRGGGPVNEHYYFRGNLMTPEFWAQIRAGDEGAARLGAAGAARGIAKKAQRRFPQGF